MQSNWTALQTKMKGKGGKAPRPEKRVDPEASGSRQDARVTKKRKTKHARRRANDDDATRGRSSEETPETAAASRRTHAKPSHETRSRADPVRFDGGDAAPRASAPPRPSDDARILDDTAPLAPERRRAFSAAASVSPDAAGDGLSQDLRAAPVEAARLEAVSHLCFAFERAASNLLGANRWANAFEELMLAHDARADPLVPTDDAARAFCAERFARAELAENLGETELPSEARRDVIERATASVVAAARRARDAIARAAARASGTPRNSDAVSLARVRVERVDAPAAASRDASAGSSSSAVGRGTRDTAPAPARVRLRLGQAKVELRAEHFQKLARLWHSRRRAAGAAAAETEKDAAEIEGGAFCETDVCGDARFLRAAFACAARVVAAQGGMHRVAGGHHAALHGEVFDVLKYGSLRVEAELFASPLNCRYDVFCSAHADVDAPFGSLGSFFAFAPRDGSFEVNPPFVSALVARVAARLESLLADAEARGAALSFPVITPHWPRRAAWEALAGSAFRVRPPLVIAARDHGYVDGAQHCRKKRHKPASCDTSVLFLQTSRGRDVYPPTDETVEALKDAFRRKR